LEAAAGGFATACHVSGNKSAIEAILRQLCKTESSLPPVRARKNYGTRQHFNSELNITSCYNYSFSKLSFPDIEKY
jgi:nitrogenase molybdenum-iron protein alpha/beta subunit